MGQKEEKISLGQTVTAMQKTKADRLKGDLLRTPMQCISQQGLEALPGNQQILGGSHRKHRKEVTGSFMENMKKEPTGYLS